MISISDKERNRVLTELGRVYPERVAGLSDARISRFEDGISNFNFLVEPRDAEGFVFRLLGVGAEGMVDRTDERFNTLIATRLGLTPDVLYFDEKTGVKMTRFIANAETLHNDSIKATENLEKIAALLRTLHSSHMRLRNDFNPFKELIKYEGLLEKANGDMSAGYADVRDKVLGLEDELTSLGVDVVPCHCDALPENWIVDPNGRMYLLDWEYAGMNDPYWDIVAPFLEASFAVEQERTLLSAYFDGSIPSVAERKVLIYKIMMDMIWSIWARIKELAGGDYREYGVMRLHRGIENIARL